MWRKNKKQETQEINIMSIIAERIYQRDTCIFIYGERKN